MINASTINRFLHANNLKLRYQAKVGDRIQINLPRFPLTRHTQFVRVDQEKQGDTDCFIEELAQVSGEGSLIPKHIYGKAIHPGKVNIVLSAKNRLSGQDIPGVEPLNIAVEVF